MNLVTDFNKRIMDNNLTDKPLDSPFFFKECSKLIMNNARNMAPVKLIGIIESFNHQPQM
jgi:hypothetical protein